MSQGKIIIAVTGHRDIIETELLREKVSAFFDEILNHYNDVTLLSPLAEGADTLVAKVFLEKRVKWKHLRLEVPMPFSQKRYEKEFESQSHREFLTLLQEASKVYEVPKVLAHAYENLGDYVVQNSEVLLALWDGNINNKRGGTSDVVTYAKRLEHEVVHLLCERKNI